MLRELENPGFIKILFYLGMAIVGMALVASKFDESLLLRERLGPIMRLFQ
jgi:hypothetical protein